MKETSFEPESTEEEFSPDVIEALLRLTPKERAVVYGRIIEKKSYSELAKISNISEVALRKRYTRAKQKLANVLRSSDTIKGNLASLNCGGETVKLYLTSWFTDNDGFRMSWTYDESGNAGYDNIDISTVDSIIIDNNTIELE